MGLRSSSSHVEPQDLGDVPTGHSALPEVGVIATSQREQTMCKVDLVLLRREGEWGPLSLLGQDLDGFHNH